MWIATSFGFLMPAIRPPKTVKWGDDRTLQVRARRAKDLDILRAEYMKGKLGPTIHTPAFDYEYRAYCTPEAFAVAMMQMTLEIDYLKFKPTTDRYEDNELHNVYNQMWSVLLSGLSTRKHQYQYWNHHKDGRTYAQDRVNKANSSSTTSSKVTGTGYPKVQDLGTPTTRNVESVDVLSEAARLEKWYEDADRRDNGTLIPGTDIVLANRNTSADRDTYEPEVIDAVVLDGDADTAAVKASIMDEVDRLYDEIDAILDLQKVETIEHSKCAHRDSESAKNKCRARHRRAVAKTLSELRKEIKAIEDAAADAAADDPNWVGYPWEKGPRYANS